MNVPNTLTLIRLFLIPVFILFFFSNIANSLMYSIIIFIVAGITDIIDGYIARKHNLITKLGTILDPLADKFMLITVLICFFFKNYIPLWIVIIVIIKELFMILGGVFLYNNDIVVSSNVFGKLATFIFYLSIATFLINSNIGLNILYVAVFATLIAFINYFINYFNQKKLYKKNRSKSLI